jgi:hypothetical protein
MIIVIAFLLFAVNAVIFVVTGDWLNGLSAVAFAVAGTGLAVHRANRKIDEILKESDPS